MKRKLAAIIITCSLGTFCHGGMFKSIRGNPFSSYSPQHGDILFQSLPCTPLIVAIEGSSGSPYSHCGIVVKKNNGWHVLEAIGPVKETPLSIWVRQGRRGSFAAHRLRAEHRDKIEGMIAAAREFTGRPYDIQYELDDEKIYCSELIWKGFLKAGGGKLGRTCKLGDLDWKPHEAVIKSIAGGEVPLNREMITPKAMAEAEQLELVAPFGSHLVK